MTKTYYTNDIYNQMQVSYERGILAAFGWILAKADNQELLKKSDSETMAGIRMILEAYKEVDQKRLKERQELLCRN